MHSTAWRSPGSTRDVSDWTRGRSGRAAMTPPGRVGERLPAVGLFPPDRISHFVSGASAPDSFRGTVGAVYERTTHEKPADGTRPASAAVGSGLRLEHLEGRR